jgi:hypothetical protein
MPHAHVHVVANKVQQGVGEISRADFESSIERKLGFAIPYDPKAAANAARLGQTFLGANRTAKASQPIRDVAQAIASLSEESDDAAVPGKTKAKAKPTSLLGRFDFKKMLPPRQDQGRCAGLTAGRIIPRAFSQVGRSVSSLPGDVRRWRHRGGAHHGRIRGPNANEGKHAPVAAGAVSPFGQGGRQGRSAVSQGDRRAHPRAYTVAGSQSRIAALELRLHRTGKGWTLKGMPMPRWAWAGVAALVFLKSGSLMLALPAGCWWARGFPMVVNRAINRRTNGFVARFPDALELLVRGCARACRSPRRSPSSPANCQARWARNSSW